MSNIHNQMSKLMEIIEKVPQVKLRISLSDGAAGEPGILVIQDENRPEYFSIYFIGGFVCGSPEEIIITFDQFRSGMKIVREKLVAWFENPEDDSLLVRGPC